jgi:hypothetical protein
VNKSIAVLGLQNSSHLTEIILMIIGVKGANALFNSTQSFIYLIIGKLNPIESNGLGWTGVNNHYPERLLVYD